jgi:hypothetical protein
MRLAITRASGGAPKRMQTSNESSVNGLGHAQHLLHVVDLAEDAAGMFQDQLTFGRETHAPRRPVHERQANPRLHQRQMLADRRSRDPELTRCGAEAAGTCER